MRSLIIFCFIIIFGRDFVLGQGFNGFMSHGDLFGRNYFIENKGQFKSFERDRRGLIYAKFDGEAYDAFLDSTGIIIKLMFYEAEEKQFWKRDVEDEETPKHLVSQNIYFTWLNANDVINHIQGVDSSSFYYTYGDSSFNSFGFKKYLIKDIYSHVDLLYKQNELGDLGYELIVHPGADLSQIEFSYSGHHVNATLNENNTIQIKSDRFNLVEEGIKAFTKRGKAVGIRYVQTQKNTFSYSLTENFQFNEDLIIDPWLSNVSLPSLPTGNIVSVDRNKAYDIDYDYLGNVYILGGGGIGGNPGVYNDYFIAKYNDQGVKQWVFACDIPAIAWKMHNDKSNFICDRSTGELTIGQCDYSTGTRIIKINSLGNYNNYVTNAIPEFQEIWDFAGNCHNSAIWVLGGSTTSNLSYGSLVSTNTVNLFNFTGSSNLREDVVAGDFNSLGDLYVLMCSVHGPPVDKKIYKLNPYTNSIIWSKSTKTLNFIEYLNTVYQGYGHGNSYNALSANSKHVFYTDGVRVWAMSGYNGKHLADTTGQMVDTAYVPKFQGGIYASECDDVILGGVNKIAQYHFDSLAGFSLTKNYPIQLNSQACHVYDLKYDPIQNLIYACGDSFVCAISSTLNCPRDSVEFTIIVDCESGNINAHVMNTLIASEKFVFVWVDDFSGKVVRNFTGILPYDTLKNVITGHNYTLYVYFYYMGQCSTLGGFKSLYVPCVFKNVEPIYSSWDIPTAFSPNGDGNNDVFKLVYHNQNFTNPVLKIYNRWGECVFSTNNINTGWNGTYKGYDCEIGSYIWTFSYVNSNNEMESRNGHVTLLR
jgi:gliding motility-associated-like protein